MEEVVTKEEFLKAVMSAIGNNKKLADILTGGEDASRRND